MTETIPFSPVQAADDDNVPTDRKKLLAVGGVAALLLAAGGYFLLGGGSSAPADGPIVKGHPRAALTVPRVAQQGAKAAPKPLTLPAASTARLGRDPFKALVTPPVAPDSGAGASSTAGTAAAGTTSTTTSGGEAGSTTSSTSTAPYSLKLASISSTQPGLRTYTFGYGTATKKVIAGQKFGKYGEIVVLAPVFDSRNRVIGALIQVGDADPKSIAVGARTTVA